jgi:hypothetical protein
MSKLRGFARLLSILAILHLLGLAGVVGYMWSNGTLNPARAELIADVLRGKFDAPAEPGAETDKTKTEEGTNAQGTVADGQMHEEIARRQLDREKAELEQRLELVTREMNQSRQERESFEEQRRRDAEAAKRKTEQTYRAGFEKQLEYFAKMKPKDAAEYLLNRELEEAAELLRAMDARTGKKIIEAAKTPAQRKKIDDILKLLPELKAEPTETASKK